MRFVELGGDRVWPRHLPTNGCTDTGTRRFRRISKQLRGEGGALLVWRLGDEVSFVAENLKPQRQWEGSSESRT